MFSESIHKKIKKIITFNIDNTNNRALLVKLNELNF